MVCTIRRYKRTAIGALIGDRLRAAREDRKMMGKYVAKRLGVSPATYSQIESGQRDLTVQRLDTIRSILGLTWNQLLAEEVGKNGGQPASLCRDPESQRHQPENQCHQPENQRH